MKNALLKLDETFKIESFILVVIFSHTWLGLGRKYLLGLIVLTFIFSFLFKNKRNFILRDKLLIILLIIFTINNVISSLLSVDRLISTLLSLLWFLVVFIPMSYAGFSVNKKNEVFCKWIVPVSFIISLIIILYLSALFFHNLFTKGFTSEVFERYSFHFLGKATTPDTIVMLSGIGYGFIVQKEGEKYKWLGLLYLLFCFFGIILAFDRGGVIALFIIMFLLLSFDWKRLIVLVGVMACIIFLSIIFEPLKKLQYLYNFLFFKSSWVHLVKFTQLAAFGGAWGMIKDHWLMGVGTNNFSKFVKQYGTGRGYSYAHNFILQFWAENGFFGMIFGLSIIGLVIYRWIKSWRLYKYKYIAFGVGASFIGMLVGNLTNSTIWIMTIALPFWLLAGVLSAIYFIVKEETNNFEHEEVV